MSFSDVAGKVRDGGCPTTFCKIERKCSCGKNGEGERRKGRKGVYGEERGKGRGV